MYISNRDLKFPMIRNAQNAMLYKKQAIDILDHQLAPQPFAFHLSLYALTATAICL